MAHARRDEPLVPSFAVQLNGQPLVADMALWIVNVIVEDDLDMPSMFTLELISREDEHGTTSWTDEPRLALGAKVEISMGYGDDRDSLLMGEITALEPTFSIGGPATLIVRGYDKRYRLNTVRRTRSYVERTDSNIAEQICADVNVAVQSTDSDVTHKYVLQNNQTDLAFLRERAQRMEFELAMDGETLLFRPVASAASSVVTLTLNNDLLDFRPRMSLVPVSELRVRGWDPIEKQAIVASSATATGAADAPGGRSAGEHTASVLGEMVETMVRAPVASQAEADQMASARFSAAELEFIRGDGRARGRTDVRAGRVVRLDDLGQRFSGDYYVTSTVHRYSRADGYLTDFRAQRSAS